MQQILLFDADGVVIPKSAYFSKRYAAKFGLSDEILLPFFKTEFLQCQLGKKDLKEVLPDYLTAWQWSGTVEELVRFWFEDGSAPVAEVMTVVQTMREAGNKCYLATDQEKYRAAYLWNDVNLAKDFDGAFFSCDLGVRKKESAYWEKVLAALGNPDPASVYFWDDEEENVAMAKAAGIDAHFFTKPEELKATFV